MDVGDETHHVTHLVGYVFEPCLLCLDLCNHMSEPSSSAHALMFRFRKGSGLTFA
jgi:hypothetical protein